MSFWLGHYIFNFLKGMIDQATSWRTKAGGHKRKSMKWWKSLQDYVLFVVLIVNKFNLIKLANPQDKQTLRQYKMKCAIEEQ